MARSIFPVQGLGWSSRRYKYDPLEGNGTANTEGATDPDATRRWQRRQGSGARSGSTPAQRAGEAPGYIPGYGTPSAANTTGRMNEDQWKAQFRPTMSVTTDPGDIGSVPPNLPVPRTSVPSYHSTEDIATGPGILTRSFVSPYGRGSATFPLTKSPQVSPVAAPDPNAAVQVGTPVMSNAMAAAATREFGAQTPRFSAYDNVMAADTTPTPVMTSQYDPVPSHKTPEQIAMEMAKKKQPSPLAPDNR